MRVPGAAAADDINLEKQLSGMHRRAPRAAVAAGKVEARCVAVCQLHSKPEMSLDKLQGVIQNTDGSTLTPDISVTQLLYREQSRHIFVL